MVKYNKKDLTKVKTLLMGCCKTTKKLMQVCFCGALIKEADEILQKTRQ